MRAEGLHALSIDAAGLLDAPGMLTVPWRGCVLHRIHLPRPSRTHKHHRFPKYLQMRLWGEVRDHRVVDVCPTGHDDVHAAIEAFLRGLNPPKGVGRKEREYAMEAMEMFRA